jgi:hypothetical protein
MAELGTLEGLKDKLSIPATDTSRDAELELLLLAAQRYVLRQTRYAVDDGTITAEIHENVREGDAIYAKVRPIDETEDLVVSGRLLGSDSWTILEAELVDANEGRIRIVNSIDAPWPPVQAAWSAWPWGRRRKAVWPIVRLAYANLEAPAEGIEDLALVVEVLAAHWDREGAGAGTLTGQTAGIVSETYGDRDTPGSIPTAVSLILTDYAGGARARRSR